MTRRTLLLSTLPGLTCCSTGSGQETGQPAPKFHAKALDGSTFDNASLKGKVVLVQFWATWCRYCRGDQAAVDKVTVEFAKEGLVVLAVNVGESRLKVEGYLEENPRLCHVVLSKETNLPQAFQAEGFPKYVLIDRAGKIAGNQDGAGGLLALRDLLTSVGLRRED